MAHESEGPVGSRLRECCLSDSPIDLIELDYLLLKEITLFQLFVIAIPVQGNKI